MGNKDKLNSAVADSRFITQVTLVAQYELIQPGQAINLPINKRTGPTEVAPSLTFRMQFADSQSGAPVKARDVKLVGWSSAGNVGEVSFQMSGDIRSSPLEFVVEADGYESWRIVFRHKVNYSRHIYWRTALVRRLV